MESRGEIRESRDAVQRRRRFTLLATVLGLAGAIVVLLMLLRPTPRPYYLPLFVTHDHAEEVSWVPLGRNDLRAITLRGYFSRPRAARPAGGGPDDRGPGCAKTLKPADTVVVEISAQARTGEKGEVFFLPADAGIDDPESWVRLREVLGWLGDCPAHRKLLILETTRPEADPLHGRPRGRHGSPHRAWSRRSRTRIIS